MADIKNFTLFLLIVSLFLGATVEISEGSIPIGILLFVISALLISKIKFAGSDVIDRSFYRMLLGITIIAADVIYNISAKNQLGTLDIMAFLFGLSLIAYDFKNEEVRRMGKFGAYMSATFILLFLFFFEMFGYFNIDFMHLFDHYFVLTPSISFIKAVGLPIDVTATETVSIKGVEEMNVIIGGPCSGLYSMFLLIGIMVAYTRIEPIDKEKFYPMLVISIAVAYVANLIRVSTLYVVGFYYGKDTMLLVHEHIGWIIFAVVVTTILYVLDRIGKVTTDQA